MSNNAADVGELLGMVDQAQANTGSAPSKVSADAGYKSEANFAGLEERGIDGYVACGREAYDERLQAPRGRIPDKATRAERMARKLLTKAGRAVYRKRKHTAEPPIGWVKNVLGFRQFSLRDCTKVRAAWRLVCAALNLRRMAAWA